MARSDDPVISHNRARPISRHGAIVASLGHAVEWFDWNAYVIFSVYFADNFFPPGAQGTAQLKALAIFAVGFLFRPLGGLLLGGYADRRGRRAALMLSVLLMAGGSLLIATCPTYYQVGLVSPVLLLVARIAQGLSTGGEMAAASTYLAEIAPPGRRGFYSSFVYLIGTVGNMSATLVATFLVGILGTVEVAEWGWRVPFAIGAVLGVCGFYLRRSLNETGPYLAGADLRVRRPLWEVIRRHPASAFRVAGFTMGATVVYYTFLVYLPGYAQRIYHVSAGEALWAALGAQALMVTALPFCGALSDRVGRKPLLITFSAGLTLLAVPLFSLLSFSAWTLFGVMSVALLLFACYASCAPAAMAELFPTQVRSVGLGFPYSLTVATFGGTAPYLVEWLTERGRGDWFGWYVVILCGISLIVYVTARETKGVRLDDF